MKPLSVGIVISTYNSPRWLEKTLWGYLNQTVADFELVIADDGSGQETSDLIAAFREKAFPGLKHVWHPDDGFQKSKILNEAIKATTAEYLIFTDQDCIPRKDFVATHLKFAEKGYFLSGGYFKLPMDISSQIKAEDVATQRAFDLGWLKRQGLKTTFKNTKLMPSPAFTSFMNFITPTKATWNGCNASGWREDMIAINGYNEDMQYGGQDREFGERLFNLGIKSKQIRYSAICVHLDHKRPYKTPETMAKNKAIRKNTKQSKIIKTPHGISKEL